MIINDLDGYYIVFDTKNWNTELDTLINNFMVHNNPLFTKDSLKAALSYIGNASFTLIYDGNDIHEQKHREKPSQFYKIRFHIVSY